MPVELTELSYINLPFVLSPNRPFSPSHSIDQSESPLFTTFPQNTYNFKTPLSTMAKKVISKVSRDAERHAFSGGIIFAAFTLIISLLSKFFGILGQLTNIILDTFGGLGYDITIFGIFLGLIYSFLTGFIVCGVYSWIFNKLPSRI